MIFALLLQPMIFVPMVKAECTVEPYGEACADPNVPSSCEPTYEYTCEGTTQYDTCPPNYHLTPNGGCQENGTGGTDTGGGGYNYLSCPAGQRPTGGVMYLPGSNFSCMGGGACDQWFPSSRNPDSECGGVNRGDCSVAQLCCAPGYAVECGNTVWTNDVMSTDTLYHGYYNCPGGKAHMVHLF